MHKIIYGSTTPPLRQFVNIRTTAYGFTRGAARGDCIIPFRKSSFSQSAFSARAALEWNSIPATIRDLNTYSLFRAHLKRWLIGAQICQHQFFYTFLPLSGPSVLNLQPSCCCLSAFMCRHACLFVVSYVILCMHAVCVCASALHAVV